MEKIYSKTNPEILLHIIYTKQDMESQQEAGVDISPEKEFLQLRSLKADLGKKYQAHKHLPQSRSTDTTHESIVVISGKLKSTHYDIDDKKLGETILNPGDVVITFRGGHEFEALTDNTLFYEHKNGPYQGLVKDKEAIEND